MIRLPKFRLASMRLFQKTADPLLAPPTLPTGWCVIQGVGIGPLGARVLTYTGILALLAVAMAPFAFGSDPIQLLAGVLDTYGTLTVVLGIPLGAAAWMVLHEALHVVMHPDRGRSDLTVLGIHQAMAFTLYTGVVTKRQFLRCLLTPLVILSLLLLLAWELVPTLRPVTALFVVMHVTSCFGDLVLAVQLLRLPTRYTHFINRGVALLGRKS